MEADTTEETQTTDTTETGHFEVEDAAVDRGDGVSRTVPMDVEQALPQDGESSLTLGVRGDNTTSAGI